MNYIPINAVCEKLRARLDAIDDVKMHCSQPMKMSSMKGPFVFVRMYLRLKPRLVHHGAALRPHPKPNDRFA